MFRCRRLRGLVPGGRRHGAAGGLVSVVVSCSAREGGSARDGTNVGVGQSKVKEQPYLFDLKHDYVDNVSGAPVQFAPDTPVDCEPLDGKATVQIWS